MSRSSRQRGTTLIEVLAAAVIVLVVIGAAVGAFFATVFSSVREIVDTETKPILRSIEDSLRAGVRTHLSPAKDSFYADIEGVRVLVFLPQPGQPKVDLPDYVEDINGNGIAEFATGPDVDWDRDGRLHAPGFAKPEYIHDSVDHDGDGQSWESGDRPGSIYGSPEPFVSIVGEPRSPAYNGIDDDNDGVIDDRALFLYPFGLLIRVEAGAFNQSAAPNSGFTYSPAMESGWTVLPPMNEDLNMDGFVSRQGNLDESALNLNPDTQRQNMYLPDTFEDLNGDGRISEAPPGGDLILDINHDGVSDAFEFSEDFNLNGFLDVPSPVGATGLVYYHESYGPGGRYPADALTQGWKTFGQPQPMNRFPTATANFAYSMQTQAARNFGYALHVERMEQSSGMPQGFGRLTQSRYRITVDLYFDYAKNCEQMQRGEMPKPIQVHQFELEIP